MGCGPSTPSAAAVSPLVNVRPPPLTEEEKLAQKLKMAEEMRRECEASVSECEAAESMARFVMFA